MTHLRPFGIPAYVTAPKTKLAALKAKGLANHRAERGYFMGFTSMWDTTPQVLLSDNRMVASLDVVYDLHEVYGPAQYSIVPEDAPLERATTRK